MATGENNTTWGDVTNLNLGTAIEEAIVGSADVTFASGDVTLTLTDTNASQTARNMRLRCTGTTGGSTRNLVVPSIEKPYIVRNDCADSVTVKTAAGTGIAVPAGKTMWVYSDGTNVVDAVTHLSSLTLGTDLSVADGGTGASTFTANGLLYGNGSSALQVTAAGTTGQVLVGNTGSAPSWATLTSSAVTSISFGSTGLTPSTPTQGAVTVAGTLGVTNGGTGTSTQFTAGSVVFAGASGVYTQDNAQLFWDNSNDRLGIGTATPSAKLSVVGTAKIGEGAASNSAKLMVNTVSGAAAGIQLFQDGNESWVIENPASTTALTFANSGTERMRITGAGNVGIGTSSPSQKLHVVGATGNTPVIVRSQTNASGNNFDYAAFTAAAVGHTGGIVVWSTGSIRAGQMWVQTDTSTPLVLGTNDTERMRITAAGNVGIGTASPYSKLEVSSGYITAGTDSSTASSKVLGAYYTTGHLTTFGSEQSNGGPVIGYAVWPSVAGPGNFVSATPINIPRGAYTIDGASHKWYSGGAQAVAIDSAVSMSEAMRLTDTGNLGIGTASPGARLETSVTSAGATAEVLRLSNPGSGANTQAQLNFYTTSTSYATITGGYGASAPQMTFNLPSVTAGNYVWQISSSEKMRLDTSGNLGIGTATPAAKLQVVGNMQVVGTSGVASTTLISAISGLSNGYEIVQSAANALTYNWRKGDNTVAMTLDSAGNLGIGTSSPSYKLDVSASGTISGRVKTTGSINAFYMEDAGTTVGTLYIGSVGNDWRVVTGSNERMRIDSSGNVGIGTSNPAVKLAVEGTGNTQVNIAKAGTTGYLALGANSATVSQISAFRSDSPFVANLALNPDGGNVGIGTSAPNALLTVSNGGAAGYEINPTGGVGGGATVATYNRSTLAYTSLTTYASAMTWYANGTTRAMDLDSSGNLLVGTTSSDGYRFKTEGSYPFLSKGTGGAALTAASIWNNDTAGDNIFIVFSTETGGTTRGSIDYNRAGGLTRYNTTSDYRAKDIIGLTQNSGEVVDALKVYDGKMKGATIERPMLIAHEAQEVVPYAVTGEKDAVNEDGTPKFQQIDVSSLVPLLIAEIQSLRARVAQLEGN
jgi:hypothetical protein